MAILKKTERRDGIYVSNTFEGVHQEVQEKVEGTQIQKLEDDKLSLPFWEKTYYYKHIKSYLKDIDKDSAVLDVGCGDGRFTEMVLEMGFTNVFSMDSNVNSLQRLKKSLESKGKENNVKIIHGDVLDMPFEPNSFDVVLSIGVLYYLNENYESGLKEVKRCMDNGCRLIETEPDKIGNAIKALIFDGIDRFIKVCHNNKFLEYFSEQPIELRCFEDSEIKDIYQSFGLSLIGQESVPLIPSLLVIANKHNMISSEKIKSNSKLIAEAIETLEPRMKISKHKLWISELKDN